MTKVVKNYTLVDQPPKSKVVTLKIAIDLSDDGNSTREIDDFLSETTGAVVKEEFVQESVEELGSILNSQSI